MKHLLITFSLILLWIFASSQNFRLNYAGHIILPENKLKPHYFVDGDSKKIDINGVELLGNGMYITNAGYMTVESYEASVPVIVRFYNWQGNLLKTMHFSRTYGIQLSQNKKYVIFFDSKNLVTVNTENFTTCYYPKSSVFNVDEKGIPLFYDEYSGIVHWGEKSISVSEQPLRILIHCGTPFIFSRHSIFKVEESSILKSYSLSGTFFNAVSFEESLLFVEKLTEKDQFVFTLRQLESEKHVCEKDRVIYPRSAARYIHEPIQSPLKYGQEYAHPIGNSYGEIQHYGGAPYLHPGVDFMGQANEQVFAVADGVVKAVLTTGGEYNHRIAIAVENTAEETHGYLYAHLIESSIPFSVGDLVSAGDVVGELIFWPWYSFTHVHFARIKSQGAVWNGAWWTTNDPLTDVIGNIDTQPPVFENTLDNSLFAFRNESGNYLDPMQLEGDIRIICKVHDIANTYWKIDVFSLAFKIYPSSNPNEPVVDMVSYNYDFPLDTYFSSDYEGMILETIYSRDETCYSIGNYDIRQYYQIVTSTSGDEEIHEGDKDILLDTRTIPNGTYILSVTAKDAAMNEAVASMTIGINNTGVGLGEANKISVFNIYPSLATEHINVVGLAGSYYVVCDIWGRIMLQFSTKSNHEVVGVSNLCKGTYIIFEEKNNRSFGKRFIKL